MNFGDLKFGKKSSLTLKDKKESPIKLKNQNDEIKEKPWLDVPPRNEKKPYIIENRIEVNNFIVIIKYNTFVFSIQLV